MAEYELKFKDGDKTIIILTNDYDDLGTMVEAIEGLGGIDFDLECPYCSTEDDMEHTDQDDDGAGNTEDMYTCRNCNVSVTYITPSKYEQYHEVPDHEATFVIDMTDIQFADEDDVVFIPEDE